MSGIGDSHDPDAELVRRVVQGDAAAARRMVAAKLPRLLALGTRILGDVAAAEEIAQESLLRSWRQAPGWRFGAARFDTWLHQVALNLCRDRLRKRRRETLTPEPPERIDPAPLPDQALASMDENRRIERALQALPPRQREAIVLQYYQELSNADAAALMEISVEALESLLSRARRALRELLLETDDDA
ncbi:RNA polymerase sigma factor [Novosphingobium barchaimii]|uniref:RNA polymerase sigma factor n=1 Tax=Novosphingobium barchaimii TaxID=1420591 RepID=UPI000ABDD3B6|nr:RNA polymerase sigma factor [Novosphingobium barchaimii]